MLVHTDVLSHDGKIEQIQRTRKRNPTQLVSDGQNSLTNERERRRLPPKQQRSPQNATYRKCRNRDNFHFFCLGEKYATGQTKFATPRKAPRFGVEAPREPVL